MTALPRFSTIALVVAVASGGVLVLRAPQHDPPPPPGRVPVASAWPSAQRADISANLDDGPYFHPGYFLDSGTAVGTAPSPDGASVRLVVRTGSSTREIRRLPAARSPDFANFTTAGDDLVWTESTDAGPTQVWTVNLRDAGPARRLTADTGNAVFYGSAHDLVIAEGRVHWTATTPKGAQSTEIRSVPLIGGHVEVRREPGSWALTSWPWLTNGADQPSTSRLRNMATNRDVRVDNAGTELSTCSATWCRVLVMNSGGLIRIDLMHPDGTARRQIAGSAASPAITDVAVLNRFVVLDETGPASDLTGTAKLLVYDTSNERTVDLGADVNAAFSRGGVLWWSTGDQDTTIWHSLDLRTV